MVKCCCPECFDDRGLRRDIFPTLEPNIGTCSFCRSIDVPLVQPIQLLNYFELLANVYEETDEEGQTLVEWMKSDWALFSHSSMDTAHAKDLLGEILDDGNIVRKIFKPSPNYNSEGLAQWESLRNEIMHQNRWFLNVPFDKERLEALLVHLPADSLPENWYRARLRNNNSTYSAEDMGAPPARLASHGRANPAGIPYLYLGSHPQTAIAEVRPHTGEQACVATISIKGQINAIDLRAPRELVSPFLLADANAIGQLRGDIPFLERLGNELTRPVLRSGAAFDYTPSQYLCEFIKNCGYDGVVYRSSVSDGINLALFDPQRAVMDDVCNYDVTSVSVAVEQS